MAVRSITLMLVTLCLSAGGTLAKTPSPAPAAEAEAATEGNAFLRFFEGIHFDLVSNCVYVLLALLGYLYRMHTKPHRPALDPIAFILDINGTGHIDKGMLDEGIVMLIKGFEKDVLKLESKELMLRFKRKLWIFLAVVCFIMEVGWVYACIVPPSAPYYGLGFFNSNEDAFYACVIAGIVPFFFCAEHSHMLHKKVEHIEDVKKHFQEAERRAEAQFDAEKDQGLTEPLLA